MEFEFCGTHQDTVAQSVTLWVSPQPSQEVLDEISSELQMYQLHESGELEFEGAVYKWRAETHAYRDGQWLDPFVGEEMVSPPLGLSSEQMAVWMKQKAKYDHTQEMRRADACPHVKNIFETETEE